ncbi:MAG: hypothetical protein Q7R49_05580 [Candidatus Daviesbacteria bacterium]|nr:hypothetical protein [Candidatus Daviesbacteria bacterium]
MNKLNDDLKKTAEERSLEQEIWRRIVVKVISWSDGLKNGGIIKKTDTITPKEWQMYCSRTFKINATQKREKVQSGLDVTKKLIESFGGFAK